MTELDDPTKRVQHAQSLIESVTDSIGSEADVQALTRAIGLLEQAEADLAECRESE